MGFVLSVCSVESWILVVRVSTTHQAGALSPEQISEALDLSDPIFEKRHWVCVSDVNVAVLIFRVILWVTGRHLLPFSTTTKNFALLWLRGGVSIGCRTMQCSDGTRPVERSRVDRRGCCEEGIHVRLTRRGGVE